MRETLNLSTYNQYNDIPPKSYNNKNMKKWVSYVNSHRSCTMCHVSFVMPNSSRVTCHIWLLPTATAKIPPFSMLLLNQPYSFDVRQDLEPPIYLIFGGSNSNWWGAIGLPKNINKGTYTYMYINGHCRYYTELA